MTCLKNWLSRALFNPGTDNKGMIEPAKFNKLLESLVENNPEFTREEIEKLMVGIDRSEFEDGNIKFPDGTILKE